MCHYWITISHFWEPLNSREAATSTAVRGPMGGIPDASMLQYLKHYNLFVIAMLTTDQCQPSLRAPFSSWGPSQLLGCRSRDSVCSKKIHHYCKSPTQEMLCLSYLLSEIVCCLQDIALFPRGGRHLASLLELFAGSISALGKSRKGRIFLCSTVTLHF